MQKLTHVDIYTDGACSGNPGPGGWGAILMVGQVKKEISGGEADTTNNRMELMAVIKSLEELKFKCEVTIYSDSTYVVNAFLQNWISGWIRNNWRNSAKQPVANVDLWQRLIELVNKHEVSFVKVKGHADNEYNNRCDELAVLAASQFK